MSVSGLQDEKYPVCLLTYAYMHILTNFGKINGEVIEFDPETDFNTTYDYVKSVAHQLGYHID